MAQEDEATTEPDIVETVTQTATPGSRSRTTPTLEPTSGTRRPATPASLTALDRRDVLAVVTEANQRLRETIVSASEENIEDLGQLWQGKAFSIIDFAIETSDRYQQPRYVTFDYISSPQVDQQSNSEKATVITRERWRYGRGTSGKEEAFEFTYTLEFRDNRWVIVQYKYRNLPQTPTVTPTSTSTLEY
jgi:hypothetical protein